LAKQENDGKINVKIINRIEGRWDPFKFVGWWDPYKFVDGELHIKNNQYGDVIVKKTYDAQGKFMTLKFFQHRKFRKDKEIFF
jgi:hypothetical protein